MRAWRALLALAATWAMAGPAWADEPQFSITPYVWLPTVDGDLRFHVPPDDPTGPEFNPEVTVGPVDYLENLDGIFMIAGDMRFGRVGVFTDFIYLDLSREAATVATINGPGPIGAPINVGTTFDLSGMLWTLAGDYEVINDGSFSVRTFAGVRYLGVDSSVNWALTGPIGEFPQTGSADRETDAWDIIVGTRGEFVAGNWIFPYYLDVGAGDSDLTWQAFAGVGYRFGWGDLRLDYRHLEYEQGENELVQELTLSGPALGASFRF